MKSKQYINSRQRKLKKIKNYEDSLENSEYDDIEENHHDFHEDDHISHVEKAHLTIPDKIHEEDIEEEDEEEEIEKVKDKKEKKAVDKTKFYVDPKEFDEEIMIYYKSGVISDNLALMISKISHKLSFAGNFINYTYREEMVGDGVIRMMKALMAKKYNRAKGTNPFSYFTRIAFNAFRNRIKKEKHMAETHEKYQNELMLMSSNYNMILKNNNLRITKNREY
jgi:hypothetical protein